MFKNALSSGACSCDLPFEVNIQLVDLRHWRESEIASFILDFIFVAFDYFV
jgi:hypothetical protein